MVLVGIVWIVEILLFLYCSLTGASGSGRLSQSALGDCSGPFDIVEHTESDETRLQAIGATHRESNAKRRDPCINGAVEAMTETCSL